MNAREIRELLREGVHVIVRFPEAASGARVFDARSKNGVLEVMTAEGWKVASGVTIYSA